MTFSKLQDYLYTFVTQNKKIKTFIEFIDYIIYVFVVLYFLNKLITFPSFFDAFLYYLWFILFIVAAVSKKYVSVIVLLVNSIICSLNELFLTLIQLIYIPNINYNASVSLWKTMISVLINFFFCFFAFILFKKETNK